MSSIDLFLIGFLVEKPWSAYELAKFITEHNLHETIRISTPAVYKNLTKLAERGYADIQITREGGRPEKKIYSITESGLAYFHELLKKGIDAPILYHLSLNTVVMHLNKLDYEEGLRSLETIKAHLERKQHFIDEAMTEFSPRIPLVGRTIIRQVQLLNTAMLQWIQEFIVQYEHEQSYEPKEKA